jgi:hypothetical protein
MIASQGAKEIAGAIYFHFGKKAIFKYGASNEIYQNLRANNLIMWEAIQWYTEQGFDSLCFGRTDLGNDGLNQYKNGWRTDQTSIKYCKFDLRRGVAITSKQKLKGYHNKIFQNIPIIIARGCGSLLYKHFG